MKIRQLQGFDLLIRKGEPMKKTIDYKGHKIRMIPVGYGEYAAEVFLSEEYSHHKYHAGELTPRYRIRKTTYQHTLADTMEFLDRELSEVTTAMKYQGHEIRIIRQVGKNGIIKRVDGGDFETCSMLPHHGGKKVKAAQLMVSLSSIEGF